MSILDSSETTSSETLRVRSGSWLRTLVILSALVFVFSWAIAFYLVKDARFIQIVEPSTAAASVLFGDNSPGTPLGKADYYMISDPKAFLEGKSEEGALLVSQSYLREHHLYPWQSRTIWFIQSVVAWIAGLMALILLGLWLFLYNRVSQIPQTP